MSDDIKESYAQSDKNTLQINRVITSTETVFLSLDDLTAKRDAILLRRDNFNTLCDAELADVNSLINQCTQLNIVSTIVAVVEPVQDTIEVNKGVS